MIVTAGIGLAAFSSPPSPWILGMLALSVALAGGIGFAHDRLGHQGVKVRMVAVAGFVVTPLFLFGLGMTMWTVNQQLPWDVVLAALLCVGGIASAYLRRQPALIFASQIAIWSAAVFVQQSLAGAVALFVALCVAVPVSREQQREQHDDEVRREARDRMQTRARDILTDYEKTQQGWFWETDRRSLLTYISAPIANALGYAQEDLIGQPFVDLFNLERTEQEGERTLMFHLTARSFFRELPVRAAIDGEERWWSVSGRPIYDNFHNFVGFRGSGTDLTEKKRSQEDASRLAHFDSLTGLANRFQMSQTLEHILTAPRDMNRECSVLLLDLDRFKRVNDTMGHPAGDALLQQVAQRLKRAVDQMGKVGRLGGDEFEVIVGGRTERRALANLAETIIHSLSQPYSIDGQRVVIGVSVGIAISPEHGTTSEELIRNADLALYAAKDGGRGRYHFYAQDLHAEAEARAQLERDLRDAIVQGDLQLFYQPVVSTATECITGFEALMRWRHPVKGWIPPDKFVAAGEETGLIAQMGEWALRTACHDLAKWPEEVRVAVNVSPLQFSNPQLPNIVTNALARAGVDPSRLELEITESVFLNDDEGTDAMFAALKRVGVRMALDDFGTGYSSLGYLKKAPFDKIKIDQSFVRGATQPGSRNGAIIASITSLAQALGMDTTAEGVETLDELDLVRMHGCSHVQGFIYECPLSSEDALARLEQGLAAIASGPRSARAPRQTMLRKVVLDHEGQRYKGTIRNISDGGAMVEGLWNVPIGTIFEVRLSESHRVKGIVRWCQENRMGLQFELPLGRDDCGRIAAVQEKAPLRLQGAA
ncbi:diguanylate cyclase (GGDEF)-like protein/PAS domain S-box-containing protein [Altererythrobacter atlanticus]|nr:diguanylate cyclase (GGDEF)-like protein/PAS domain S-box-containing protein [Croceibacterium atlanticum]